MPATIATAMSRVYGVGAAAKVAVVSPLSVIKIVRGVCGSGAARRERPTGAAEGLAGAADAEGPGGLAGGVPEFQEERDEGGDDGVHREAGQRQGGGEQEGRSVACDHGRVCGRERSPVPVVAPRMGTAEVGYESQQPPAGARSAVAPVAVRVPSWMS